MYKGSFDFLSHPPPGFFPYSDKVRLLQKYVIPPQHPTSSRWHRYSCTVDVRNERQSTLPLDFAYWLWVEERGVAAARVVTITSLSLTSDKTFRLTRSTKHRPVHCGIKSQKCRSTCFQVSVYPLPSGGSDRAEPFWVYKPRRHYDGTEAEQ